MKTKYIINPSFRFHTWCLVVEWHEVPYNILQSESQYPCEGRSIYAKGKQCQVMAQTNEKKIDFYYHPETVFENRNVQAWLRNIIKNSVLQLQISNSPKGCTTGRKRKIYMPSRSLSKNLREGIYGGNALSTNRYFCHPSLLFFHWNW